MAPVYRSLPQAKFAKNAPPSALAQVATNFPANAQTGLLIAHNPGLEEWIGQLSGAQVGLPTAGLAAMVLVINSWPEIDRAPGRLLYYVIPRLIKAITR